MNEKWHQIQGSRDIYEVSNTGQVRTVTRNGARGKIVTGKMLKSHPNSTNYLRVRMSLPNTKSKEYFIHRLVATEFIPNPENKPFVNHIDGNKQNNMVDNLEWCSRSENEKHAWKTGLKNINTIGTKGEKHGMSKLTQKDVDYIRSVHKPYDPEFGSAPLAKTFNVCAQTITNIVNNKNWKD